VNSYCFGCKTSNSGAFYLASNVGGKIEKTQVKSAVKILSLSHLLLSHFLSGFVMFYDLLLNYIVLKCRYEKYHVGGDDEERKANYTDMVRPCKTMGSSHSIMLLLILVYLDFCQGLLVNDLFNDFC
jgi:hypothetical protein